MTKQTHRQRKALRSTKKGNSSLRRKTPPHPSPAALRKLGAAERLWVLRDDLHRASLAAPNHELFKRYGAWGSRLAMALIDLRIASGTRPTNEMGAERAHASEPVQSPAQRLASALNSENLKPRPGLNFVLGTEPPPPDPIPATPNWLHRLWAKLMGR